MTSPPTRSHPFDDLELLVEQAELEAAITLMRDDLAAGVVPAGMHRPLHPWEIAARTNFAAIDDAGAQLKADLTRTLNAQRQRLLAALEADIRNQADVGSAFRRIMGMRTAGIDQVAGAADIIAATKADAEELLFAHALDAAERLRQEAIAQGRAVSEIASLDIDTITRLDDTALRLAQGPPADLLRTISDEISARRLTFATPDEMADHVRGLGGSLSLGPLEAHAGEAVGTTEGTARQNTAQRIGTAAAIYASELLDRNTCGPCSLVDGHRYVDESAALVDYPAGVFRQCEGGLRCRGTLVYVWDSEAVPTIDEAPPAGPATLPPEPPPTPPPATPTQDGTPTPPAHPTPTAPAPATEIGQVLEPPPATAEDLAAAAADLPRIKALYRAHAKTVQDDALGFFDQSGTFEVQRPPPIGQVRLPSGRMETTGRRARPAQGDAGAANWDWFDSLHPDEQKRLRRRFMADPNGAVSPDVMAQFIGNRYGLDEDQALKMWLEQTRRYDAAGALARGKLPALDAYGGADINALVDSPYDLRVLFGPDLEAAAGHVAEINAQIAGDDAARIFSPTRPGFDPPWAMGEDRYVAELLDLEDKARRITAISDDVEWGKSFAAGDQAVLDRLDELIPKALDDENLPEDPRNIHRMIISLARRSGLIQ